MDAYNKIFPRRTHAGLFNADFSKIDSRDLPQSKNQKLATAYFFFLDHVFCATLIDWTTYKIRRDKDESNIVLSL